MNKYSLGTAIALLLGIVMGLLLSGGNYVSAVAPRIDSFNTRTGDVTLL
jgi:hypothetical protein